MECSPERVKLIYAANESSLGIVLDCGKIPTRAECHYKASTPDARRASSILLFLNVNSKSNVCKLISI